MNRLTRYALGLLVEEMGEALQLIGKALRFGLDTPGPDAAPYHGKTARQLLEGELGDVSASIAYAEKSGLTRAEPHWVRAVAKLDRLLDPNSRDAQGRRLAPDPAEREA